MSVKTSWELRLPAGTVCWAPTMQSFSSEPSSITHPLHRMQLLITHLQKYNRIFNKFSVDSFNHLIHLDLIRSYPGFMVTFPIKTDWDTLVFGCTTEYDPMLLVFIDVFSLIVTFAPINESSIWVVPITEFGPTDCVGPPARDGPFSWI